MGCEPEDRLEGMNQFSSAAAAKRYAASRPYFHPVVRDLIRSRLPKDRTLQRGLDVACGTGQSSRMLAELVEAVDAVDASEAMLALAEVSPRITYRLASAEELPFAGESFDLLTAGLAFHWFDRDRFLPEVHRVLRPAGLLVIYNAWFTGEMVGNERFADWHREEYLNRFPSPRRDSRPFTATDAARSGLVDFWQTSFVHDWTFSVAGLTGYLMSQSNVNDAIDAGRERVQDVAAWLEACLAPFWSAEGERFRFAGVVMTAQKHPG
jgi:ubiquinone/menaquinone biosynthesis C-methylase UbiE